MLVPKLHSKLCLGCVFARQRKISCDELVVTCVSPCSVTGRRRCHNAKVNISDPGAVPSPQSTCRALGKNSVYLYPVWLDQMHVEGWCVGKNLPTSLDGAQDVRPHFFGQLRDGGFYYLPWVRHRHRAAFGAVSGSVPPVRGRLRRSHVSVLTVPPDSAGAESSDSGSSSCCMELWSLSTAWKVVSPPSTRHCGLLGQRHFLFDASV